MRNEELWGRIAYVHVRTHLMGPIEALQCFL